MLVKPGGSAYYQAFNFANSRHVIQAVQVNGQRLKHESDHYWSWSPTGGPIDPRGPFDFAFLGANRQVLRVRVGQLVSQDLKIQFAATPGTLDPTPGAAAAAAPTEEPVPQLPPLEPASPAAATPSGDRVATASEGPSP
jgi:hypothetical protein